ncbi:MAG TPA: hypothetical protein VKV74_03470 [Bryobacteraceae bacterium]|nr:hypothetical protein [Bryobacteraceae bacterium]
MKLGIAATLLLGFWQAQAASEEDFHVYTDPPRLLLTKQRLRLLQRERERNSARAEIFDGFMANGAPMPEPGFALALYYQIARNGAAGRKAVEWALSNQADAVSDLRQLALVFDWCGPVMSEEQAARLEAKIERGMTASLKAGAAAIPRQSARALAAIAVADRLKDRGESILRLIVEDWWRGAWIRRAEQGLPIAPGEDIYPLLEMLHALRDNLNIDLRESAPAYFQQLPLDRLSGHYPAAFPGPDNDFFVPVYAHDGQPDLKEAALSRAAALALVAYDANAMESQYLQGWLMQDRFTMRGDFGAAYEFLWANPYQPGLSYALLPLVFHNPSNGHVFARTSWEEDATWLGYFEKNLQIFQNGKLQSLRPGAAAKPIRAGGAVLMNAPAPDPKDGTLRFQASTETTFVLGLTPRTTYDVEIDDEELAEQETDIGGTLVIALGPDREAGVRIRRRP